MIEIHSMTATFGKLNQQTLTLEPGLNVLQQPNEWGKSTWCTFLVTMFYGFEPRSKSTQTALSDKEHYAPWSGQPMSGKIQLTWDGKPITISRTTKGRTPMGQFQAWYTDTHLPVEELNGTNCGQLLLGVERSVFARSAFLRQSDLPVKADDALLKRLQDLVTTGDDSGNGAKLEKQLRDLKNRCRYNHTGLLPQLEQQLSGQQRAYDRLNALEERTGMLQNRCRELEDTLAQLKNHQQALAYAQAQQDLRRLEQAQAVAQQAQQREQNQTYFCQSLPSREEAEKTLADYRALTDRQGALYGARKVLPPYPQQPQTPAAFIGVAPENAPRQAREDETAFHDMQRRQRSRLAPLWIVATVCLGVAIGLLAAELPGGIPALVGAGVLLCAALCAQVFHRKKNRKLESAIQQLLHRYSPTEPDQWVALGEQYAAQVAGYQRQMEQVRRIREQSDRQLEDVERQLETLTGGQEPRSFQAQWERVASDWADLDRARTERERAEFVLGQIQAVVRQVDPPAQPDTLTEDPAQTAEKIAACQGELARCQRELGACQGEGATLGSRETLEKEICHTRERMGRLQQYYDACDLALATLDRAKKQLQQQFAPKITQNAGALLDRLTGGRYQAVQWNADMTVASMAQGEMGMRAALWRSDGTVDQIYVALRLAVAQAVAPGAPLVLDDALVRFDDARLQNALDVLKELSRERQIILFTCQGRENQLLHMGENDESI